MDPIEIRLAGEPKGKGRPRFSRKTGHAFTPAATRSYEGSLRYAAQEAMGSRAPLEVALRVTVIAAFAIPASWPKKKRNAAIAGEVRPCVAPDADNCLKMLDSLNEVVWKDDKQIVEALITKIYSDRPSLTITVIEAPPAFFGKLA